MFMSPDKVRLFNAMNASKVKTFLVSKIYVKRVNAVSDCKACSVSSRVVFAGSFLFPLMNIDKLGSSIVNYLYLRAFDKFFDF